MVLLDKCRALVPLFSFVLFDQIACSGLGKCPKLEYMTSFNMTRFTGRWYEIERSFYLMQMVSSCVSVDLTETERGHLKVDVQTKSRWSEALTVSEGIAFPARRDPSLLVYKAVSKLPRIVSRYLPGAGHYQVIDTDYDNYAILWSCTDYMVAHTDLIWIWGRQREIDVNIRAKIYKRMDNIRLDSDRLILPKNKNCSEI